MATDQQPATPNNAVADETKSFQTPEEAAATDDVAEPAELVDEFSDDAQAKKAPADAPSASGGWRDKLKLSWPPGRKEYAVTAAAIVILGGLGFLLLHHRPKPIVPTVQTIQAKPVPKSTLVPSTLTGLPVDPRINQLPVTGVMIENSEQARPQSGLSQAGVVFEAVAEGGVTRFLALYQDTAPASVGPIRSARPYYIQWELGFDAGYAHVGGSADALKDIKAWSVHDLDEFANGGSYHRNSSRPAPHNVYTSIATLNQLEAAKGLTTSHYSGFLRKKEAPAKTPTVKNINLTLSGPAYNVHYTYLAKTNSYYRSEGGAMHIDANTNNQISPKVVVAMVVPESRGALDASGAYYSNYQVIGSGPVAVFQDGVVTTGSWAKSNATNQITFTDANGQPIKFDPGQTWLTAVQASSNISSSP